MKFSSPNMVIESSNSANDVALNLIDSTTFIPGAMSPYSLSESASYFEG